MNLRNCSRCGKMFNHIGGPAICDQCKKDIEEAINELAESLRSSIDKTTNNLTNESLRSSINYSYNQSMRTSLMTSNNNEGQGIINKLKAAFEASLNHEL